MRKTKNTAEVLRQARTRCGLSVKDVIQKLQDYGVQVSDKTIYSYESGRSVPPLQTLFALYAIYGINDPLHTLGYTDTPNTGTDAQTLTERALLNDWRNLSDNAREHVLTVMHWELAHQDALNALKGGA